jgi:hypothetical protein
MIPFGAYQLYQAEREVTLRERHMADVRAGEFAAVLGEARSSFTRRARALFKVVRRTPRPVATTLAKTSL